MRIVTLNIRHGGGQRTDQITELLISFHSDVLVLTEFRNNKNGDKIKTKLLDHGYNHFFSPSNQPINTVLIALKPNALNLNIKDLSEKDSQRACLVEIDGLKIMGVYFAQKNEKRTLFQTLLQDANSLLSCNSLIIGDFNTGLPYKDEEDKTFYCSTEFEQLNEIGFIDTWRSRHQDKCEYSWFSQSNNGFRIDHAFASGKLNPSIQLIQYDHSPRERKITDHSALVIDLNC